ncbi:MAG TPA: inositol oxygenase family protein [Vicinamibacterales bacterium]
MDAVASSPSDYAYRTYRPDSREWHFYRERIVGSTYEVTQALRKRFLDVRPMELTMREAVDYYNDIVDESDPDMDNEPQIIHAIQCAIGAKNSGLPEWAIVVGFIHDVGKMLVKLGLRQPFVVGDQWPVGCAPSDQIVCSHFFAENPDTHHPVYGTKLGVYEEGCGLDNVVMSFGHDEYLYRVLLDGRKEGGTTLPLEALHPIRYHSSYVIHTAGQYEYLLNDRDREWMPILHKFRDHIDLYTKRGETAGLERHLPGIWEVVDRYIRPDYKFRW